MPENGNFSKKSIFIVCLTSFLIYATILCPGIDGLMCHTCYPCTSDGAGVPEVCNMDGYPKGQGYLGCSFEIGAGGHRRKRCIWLRYDPDMPESRSPNYQHRTRCHLSPIDDINDDCYCFTDNCNKGNLAPTVHLPVDQNLY